jgi:endonuclease/exonuclease/phosphatase family metal-dependent hydrolase
MKNYFFILAFLSLSSQTHAQKHFNIMTFNVRYSTLRDSANAWLYRKDNAAAQVLFHETHILGVQEALHEQIVDLKDRLPRFKYVGVGRDDGKTKGEYSAIFYDTTRLEVLESQTFWLSETPSVAGSIPVLQHATLSQTWGGLFSSDHFPVFARVLIQN